MTRDEAASTTVGTSVLVNGRGDLAMDGDVKEIIGLVVQFQRLTKKGLVEVIFDVKPYYVPPKNVELVQ